MKQIDELESGPSNHIDEGRFVRVADAHRTAGDHERALIVLRQGLETHATYLPGYILLGEILTEQNRFAEALVAFDRVLEIDPDNADARAAIDRVVRRVTDDDVPQPFEQENDTPEEAPLVVSEDASIPPEARVASTALFSDDAFALIPHDVDELYMTPEYERSAPAAHSEAADESSQPQGTLGEADTVALADLLVGLLEYRDPHFRGGTSLTRLLAAAIGRELGLSPSEVNAIELGVVLRDLGQVPLKDLISKPGAELTLEERDRIAGHIETTLNLLAPLDLPKMTLDVIRHHHERWDGAGYPDGLVGKATPIAARIAGVADSFGAMISARPHRLPRRPPAAFDEISRLAGKQYDPTVVNALERVLEGADWRGVRFGLRHHILIIDNDDPRGVALALRLCSQGYLAEAVDLGTARDRFEHSRLSGLIVSAEIGDSQIRQLITELRQSARLAMLPVVVTDADSASRVLLLEAGADVCLPAGASFEELRATLGAFLRREDKAALNTRRRGEAPPWAGLQGDVQDFPLSWLLQMLNYDGRTAALFVDSDDGDEGVIYLQGGQPRHAQTRSHVGDDALRAILTWEKGSFRIGPEVKTDKQTIQRPLMKLLLDQATQDDYAAFFGAVHV